MTDLNAEALNSSTIFSSADTQEIPVGCGCPACMNGESLGEFMNQDPVADPAGAGAPSSAATKDQFADYLTDGFWTDFGTRSRQWDQDTVTFSMSNEFSASQKAGFRMAFQTWSDVADISFSEVASGGDINIVEGDDGSAYSASSIYLSTGNIASNTISIDYSSGFFGSDNSEFGNYALLTAIHEIGHSLGLGHTGDYNGSATYANDAQWTNDTHQYSVMSYFSAGFSGANHLGEYASTPMLMDIYAIQQIYGANTTIRNGNTVYGFNSTAGRDEFDFTQNVEPVVAIWDAGGTDTIDLSGYSATQTINLGEGTFSNVAGGTGNLAIAYGTIVENVVGGSGSDTIYGNSAANTLQGGDGNDTIHGSTGDDTLNGEGGSGDSVIYTSSISDFLIQISNSFTAVITDLVGSYGTDTLMNVENYIFNGTSYSFSDLEDLAAVPDTYLTRFYFDNTYWGNYSTGYGTTSYTAADMGYAGESGTIATYSRSALNGLAIEINDTGEANTLLVQGKGNADTFTISGTHTDLSVSFYGRGGDDSITITAAGADKLFGEGGNDTMRAGAGNDTLQGQDGNDTLYGDSGDDWLLGGNNNDTLYGGVGNDRLDGNSGEDTMHGGDGNDQIYGQAGNDIINGDDGDDTIRGDSGNDTINGGTGVDVIYGGGGTDIIDGGSQNDRLYGDSGDDTINGGTGADLIIGGDGEDTLNGGEGTDRIWGGSDNDTINGDLGHDELYGEGGNDTINGGYNNDFIKGGNGNDILNGDDGADTLFGGLGTDTLNGGSGVDTLYGQDGADTMNGNDGDDLINGGRGIDTIHGNDGADTIWAGHDGDTVYGDAGNDKIYAESGDDTVYGGAGEDLISGGHGNDILEGGADNDSIYGDNGNDTLRGDDGDDLLNGKRDDDTLYGGAGRDQLFGGAGNDTLYGGDGNDTLVANSGTNTLSGQGGHDKMYAGSGADTFVFEAASAFEVYDRIYNFNTGADVIDISNVLSGFYNAGSDDITDFVLTLDKGSNTHLYIDQDGDGSGWTFVAQIVGQTGLTDEAQLVTDGNLIV